MPRRGSLVESNEQVIHSVASTRRYFPTQFEHLFETDVSTFARTLDQVRSGYYNGRLGSFGVDDSALAFHATVAQRFEQTRHGGAMGEDLVCTGTVHDRPLALADLFIIRWL